MSISEQTPAATNLMGEPITLPLAERLHGITSFLPAFQESRSNPAIALYGFVQAAYDYDWVRPFDWAEWAQTPEALGLRDDESVLAQATERQLVCLLTTCIRQERFCEGILETYYRSGLLTRILERAAVMLQELQAVENNTEDNNDSSGTATGARG
jgi:Family of unknown function (DUF6508)